MKIAISGTMGAGKSVMSAYLRTKGYQVYDTDKMVHEYYKLGGLAYDSLVATFGLDVLDAKGAIDREVLSSLVFKDALLLNELESIVYPILIDEILSHQDDGSLVFYEVPLLFEAEMESYFDFVITVDSKFENRLQRIVQRGLVKDLAQERMNHQLSGEDKNHRAHYVIHNDESLEDFYHKIDVIIETLKGGV